MGSARHNAEACCASAQCLPSPRFSVGEEGHGVRVEQVRGGLVEAWHDVHVAVVDAAGKLVAQVGDPDLVTYWRSAAKPFQALPLAADGVLERFAITTEQLALCCASHSSEPQHVAIVRDLLAKIDCSERDLLCGPHPPLSESVARDYPTRGVRLTAVYSNCPGKHPGRRALARRPARVLAKVGGEGVYCALLGREGLGGALKVGDGHGLAAALALGAVLEELGVRPRPASLGPRPNVNTRGETVGELRVNGGLEK